MNIKMNNLLYIFLITSIVEVFHVKGMNQPGWAKQGWLKNEGESEYWARRRQLGQDLGKQLKSSIEESRSTKK